jgi:nucleotide-binding universal stress UspA family protein
MTTHPVSPVAEKIEAPYIVVGVDGSEGSVAALRFALDQSALTGANLLAITAWQYPMYTGAVGYPIEFDPSVDARSDLVKEVDAELEARRSRSETVPPVAIRVVEGAAAEVLIDTARKAVMLVVGARGHGPLVESLTGSVSRACATHPPCPVVVVPIPRSDPKAD